MSLEEKEFKHISVLLAECLENLTCKPGDVVVDATVGGAGHTLSILERILPGGFLVGIDRDGAAINTANDRLAVYKGSFSLVRGNYADLKPILAELGVGGVDSVLMDLGVSSFQLDEASRGFSFRQNAPLDMRMDERQSFSAHDLVNSYDENKLEKVLREYGEERWARRIAKFIIDNRPIESTLELEEVIKNAIPRAARQGDDHPARRTFQGIRIEVNKELELLQGSIESAVEVLKPGGRLCVITFHSLEDRIVKNTFKRLAGFCDCPPEYPVCSCDSQKLIKILTKKPIIPGNEELNRNPRSRSAKLRVCVKLEKTEEHGG